MDQLAIDYVTMTDEEAAVMLVLMKHQGRGNAVSVKDLTEIVNFKMQNANCKDEENISEVRVRQIVKHLIERHGKPIGSAVAEPSGYFIITNAEEMEMVCKSLRHRWMSILYRECRIRQIGLPELLGQLALEMGDGRG